VIESNLRIHPQKALKEKVKVGVSGVIRVDPVSSCLLVIIECLVRFRASIIGD